MSYASRTPLRVILITAFTGMIILSTTLISLIYYFNSKNAVNDVANQLRDEITLRITEHVKNFLTIPHRINRINARLMRNSSLNPSNPDKLAAHFRDQVDIFDSVSSIYMGNPRGGLINSGREPGTDARYIILTENNRRGKFRKYALDEDGQPGKVIATVPDFDATSRAWYKLAIEEKKPLWSSIYILFTGQDMAIAASRPVYDKNRNFLGVISVDIFLSQISNYLKQLEIGKSGAAFIVEKSGLLVASSDTKNPANIFNINNRARRITAKESQDPLISAAAESFIKKYGSFENVTEPVNHEFFDGKVRHFMQVSPIRDTYGIDWLTAVVIPESDFLEHINANNRSIALIVVSIIFLSIVISIYGTKKLTMPITTLNTVLQSILKGRWEKPDFGKPVSKEVTELTISFTHLFELLKDTLERLNLKIEQQRRTENSLRQSEKELYTEKERLSLALAAGRTGIWEIKNQSNRVYYNDTWYTMLGYKPGELPAEYSTWENLLHPDDAEEIKKRVQINLQNGEDFDISFRMKSKNGQWRWIQSIGYVTEKTPHGDPLRTIGTHTDITERKLAEKNLAEEKERLEVTLKSIGDGVIAVDTSGSITLMNRAAEEMTGWHMTEALNKNLAEVFIIKNELTGQQAENPVEEVMRTGVIQEQEKHTILISHSGAERTIADSAAPIKSSDGTIIGVVLVFRDMTEKQKLLDANIKTQKLESLGILAGGIAHDFNNLLSGIYGYMDLAKRLSADEKIKAYLEKSITTIMRARNLTNQLLTFARGGAPVRKTENIIPVVIETVEFALSGSNVSINFDIPENLYNCNFDSSQISQVIDNIAINAKQAMPYGGTLTVKGENISIQEKSHASLKDGNYIRLTLTDTGKGIPKDVMPKIFDPFFTTKKSGSGLGLTTSYSIINRHGGTIEIESSPEKGSSFIIYLPASPEAEINSETDDPVALNASGRILLVDDEHVIRDTLSALLEMMGYETVSADDGFQALQILKKSSEGESDPINAVILDLTIPGGMGGIETIEIIRKLNPDLPVFVSSGYAENPVIAEPQKYGFTASIRKPFTFDELAAILNEYLI